MELLNVIVAGLAAFGVGAVWYTLLSKRWVKLSGVPTDDKGQPANASNPLIYIVSLIFAILVAGMMRHVFDLSSITTPMKGLVSGLGIGAFLAAPWIFVNNAFSARPVALSFIDGGYATLGCTAIGLVLTLF